MSLAAAQASLAQQAITSQDFERLRTLVADHAGIQITSDKRELLYNRLRKRIRALGIETFSEYCDLLESNGNDEFETFINAMTTNLTSFFRESHHFDYLEAEVLPPLVQRKPGRVRIWSAGCSTGPEPYSVAMVVREALARSGGCDIRILATDLDSQVLKTAAAGVYPEEQVEKIDWRRYGKWIIRGEDSNAGMVRMKPELRELIAFKQLNLLQPWPMKGPLDIIFCRNVVIYFDKDTQRMLFDRMADLMAPGGHLFIGHSESLHRVSERFELLGKTIYRKIG